MVIRWIGAFGKASSLADALNWELGINAREVAAEHIRDGNGRVAHARVGLLVDRRAVIKTFPGDVWSVVGKDDKLHATRYACDILSCRQHEAFCRPLYRAIVLKEHPARMKPAVMHAVTEASKKFALPVIWIDRKGKKHSVQGG